MASEPLLMKTTMDPDILSSYRPISSLSFLSKLVERVAMSRFVRHAEDNSLFPVRQSSYCRGHSTETAVLCVYNALVRAIDKQRITGLVLLDLSCAFHTVDHFILLSILKQRFGVCGTPLSWFRSYLSDCTQSFTVCGVMSIPRPVFCSVTQGSSVGPIEFIAYVGDVSLLIERRDVNVICTPTTCKRTSTYQSLTLIKLEECCRPHQSCQQLVRVSSTAAERWHNRIDLVWIQSQSCQVVCKWSGPATCKSV